MFKIFSKNMWVVGFAIAFLVLGSNSNLLANDDSDIKSVMEELNRLKQKVDEVEKLRQRVGDLEKKLSEQEEVIGRQKKALEKVGEIAPEVKEALLPPEPKFLVQNFFLSGATLFTAEEFDPILDKHRDKELGMRDLNKIADEITHFYRGQGYLTSLAYVPAQEITDATVEFKIVEGRVGDIEVEEGKYYSKEIIRRKFPIEKGQILKHERLQKSVKRINRHPGRTVKIVLMPGEEAGTTDILLKFEEEERPMRFYLDYSNRGTKETGKDRFGLGFTHSNLFGNDDILSARFRTGKGADAYGGSLDYNFPPPFLCCYNVRIGLYGAYSRADIAGQFKVLEPEGRAIAFGAYLTYQLFDRDFPESAINLSSNITAGLDIVDVKNEILGKETSRDRLTVAKAGISFDQRDSLGSTFFSNEIRVGIPDFLGSMDEYDVRASRLSAGGEFVKYVGSLNRITRLPFSSLLVTSLRGQFTDDPLVNSEQISFGGANSIRGFPENDYLADYGWMSTIEVRTPLFLFPSGLKVPYDKEATPLRDAMQFVYFVDFGEGNLKRPRVGEESDKFLVGAGIGLRFEFWENLRGSLDWGFPVGNEDPSDDSSSTVHIGVLYEW